MGRLSLVLKRSLFPAGPTIVNTFLSKTAGRSNQSVCEINKLFHFPKIKQKVFGREDMKQDLL